MLEFLQAFERRSWRCAAELPFLVPLSKDDLRDLGNKPAIEDPK